MKPEPKPDQSVAIQQNSDDVNLGISYDINSARNTHSQHATQAQNLTRPKSPSALARLNAPKIQPQKKLKITLDSI